jgi:hypothetical protein
MSLGVQVIRLESLSMSSLLLSLGQELVSDLCEVEDM